MSKAVKRAKLNSVNSSKIKSQKESDIVEKSVLSETKGEKPNDNLDPSTNKNFISELNMMGLNEGNKQTNEDKYMGDNSLASKLSNLEEEFISKPPQPRLRGLSDSNKNFLNIIDTKDNLSEDKIKMIQTLSKVFNLNIDHNQIQLQVNNEYLDSEKKITELRKKVEETEMSNKEFYQKCKDKEDEYIQKISELEKKLTLFDKADVINLQKQNEDYEIQISGLNKTLQNLKLKQTQDYDKFNCLFDELGNLRENLEYELDLTQKMKTQLIELKKIKKKKNKSNPKVELVKKYTDVKNYKNTEQTYDDEKDNKTMRDPSQNAKKRVSIRK